MMKIIDEYMDQVVDNFKETGLNYCKNLQETVMY